MAIHIYHYNVNAEQKYFLGKKYHEFYDMIALNGNIVSHTPAGIAGFVATAAKRFYIDPQTHAFQHSTINLKRDVSDKEKREPPKYEFKPSIKKLAKERLGGAFAAVIDNDRPILPSDFIDERGNIIKEAIVKICEGTINFQTKTLFDSLDDEAKGFIGEKTDFQPKFVIAPYFYLSPRSYDKWLKINIACYINSKEICKDLPVFLALVISKEALSKLSKGIIEKISEMDPIPDGIILWIDEHIEEDLLDSEMIQFIFLLKGLKGITPTVYNSHGGYLSILLSHPEKSLLDGVGHSINYGEHRNVIPIGGGIPMARFYFPSVHSRLRFGDALGIVLSRKWLLSQQIYMKEICSCSQCKELIKDHKTIDEAFSVYGDSYPVTFRRRPNTIVTLEYPTSEAKQAAARHYLYNKTREFRKLNEKSFIDLLQDMENAYNDISPISGDELVAHLCSWKTALEK